MMTDLRRLQGYIYCSIILQDESAVGALHDTRPIVVGEHTDWHSSESQWSQCLQLLGKVTSKKKASPILCMCCVYRSNKLRAVGYHCLDRKQPAALIFLYRASSFMSVSS